MRMHGDRSDQKDEQRPRSSQPRPSSRSSGRPEVIARKEAQQMSEI